MKTLLFIFILASTLFAWDMNMYLPPDAPKINTADEAKKDTSYAESETLDSIKIYRNLFTEEYNNSHYESNITGMIVGGVLTGIGSIILIAGVSGVPSDNDDDESEDIFGLETLAAGLLSMLSYPCFMVGLPVLVYNLIYYNIHKSHERKAIEYKNSLNRLTRKREEARVRFSITPIVNVYNGSAGANLFMEF